MKTTLVILGAAVSTISTVAQTLPFISTHPQSLVVAPGSNAMFTVVSTNATAYQWRFNGTNIAWGTASSLVLTNAQTNNQGYYVAIAKNSTGWSPSKLAHLSVLDAYGTVPFSNVGNVNAQARYQYPMGFGAYGAAVNNATARLYTGIALDALWSSGSLSVSNGYYQLPQFPPFESVASAFVPPGNETYYRVDLRYPELGSGIIRTQSSYVLKLTAGGSGYPTPSADALRFPIPLEGPNPRSFFESSNTVLVGGERLMLTNVIVAWDGATFQWRKDGKPLGIITNFNTPFWSSHSAVLPFPNVQADDAGVYDLEIKNAEGWIISSKILIAVQTKDGPGVLTSPRSTGPIFACDLRGAATRKYTILYSTNLLDWENLLTLTNATGLVSFTDGIGNSTRRYYRARLLP